MENNFNDLRDTLLTLNDAIMAIAAKPAPKPTILDRELSGNKINGGVITNFSSVGIKDHATKQVLTVDNDGITVSSAAISNITMPVTVNGNLSVNGNITAEKLHVNELSADVRNERSSSLEFKPENQSLNGKGLIWHGLDTTKQLVLREKPNRIWSSEDFELYRDKVYKIDNLPVLGVNFLGDSVVNTKIQRLGVVQDLRTEGNVNLDNYIFFESGSNRLGLGTDSPAGAFSLQTYQGQFIIDGTLENQYKVGTWTNSTLQLITDNTPRIEISPAGTISLLKKVTVNGTFGVNVNNFQEDVDITTSGPVRFQNKKFEVNSSAPNSGSYQLGDIVWNNNPVPTGYIGWVCIKTGSPGIWKNFGLIQS